MEYNYFEGPSEQLLRYEAGKFDGARYYAGGEWRPYYGNPGDNVPLSEDEAKARMAEIDSAAAPAS